MFLTCFTSFDTISKVLLIWCINFLWIHCNLKQSCIQHVIFTKTIFLCKTSSGIGFSLFKSCLFLDICNYCVFETSFFKLGYRDMKTIFYINIHRLGKSIWLKWFGMRWFARDILVFGAFMNQFFPINFKFQCNGGIKAFNVDASVSKTARDILKCLGSC